MGSHLSHPFVCNLNFVLSLIFSLHPSTFIFIPLLWCFATLDLPSSLWHLSFKILTALSVFSLLRNLGVKGKVRGGRGKCGGGTFWRWQRFSFSLCICPRR